MKIRNIIKYIFLFVLILLILASLWLQKTYGDINFSTVIYQLLSPLQGVDEGLVKSFFLECVLVGSALTLLLMGLDVFWNDIYRRYDLSWSIRVFESKKTFIRKKRFFKFSHVFLLLAVFVIIQGYRVGLYSYVLDIVQRSKIYENEFVAADSIDIQFPDNKKNLILIYMESMETSNASLEEGGYMDDNYIPNLTQLAKDNISFSNSDTLGGAYQCEGTDWTIAALMSSATGINYKVPMGGLEQADLWPNLNSLGDILEKEGYNNYFMCGSDANFAGRKNFYENHGNYTIFDYYSAIEDKIIDKDYKVFWGFEDSKLYDYAKKELTEIAKNKEPFNFTMLTVDTHFPSGYQCELCENTYRMLYPNSIVCADKQINIFLSWMQEQDWYENTTVVILGDHISMNEFLYTNIDRQNRYIYNCFINVNDEGMLYEKSNRQFCTLDFCPTILASLGITIEGERLGLGTNLFAQKETLIEEMGFETFDKQLKKYSSYYANYISK